jgi:hypothetical protein
MFTKALFSAAILVIYIAIATSIIVSGAKLAGIDFGSALLRLI